MMAQGRLTFIIGVVIRKTYKFCNRYIYYSINHINLENNILSGGATNMKRKNTRGA